MISIRIGMILERLFDFRQCNDAHLTGTVGNLKVGFDDSSTSTFPLSGCQKIELTTPSCKNQLAS
jgi:hypothetical protein